MQANCTRLLVESARAGTAKALSPMYTPPESPHYSPNPLQCKGLRFRLRAPPNHASTPLQWANAPLVQQQPVERDAAIRLTSLRSRRLQAGMAESNAPYRPPNDA